MKPEVAVVAEDLAGMRSQAFGLVERAGMNGRLCPVRVKRGWSMLPAALWPSPLLAVRPMPVGGSDLIASVGGKSAAVAAALRRDDRPVVQIQNPRMKLDRFDVIIANRHDEISGPNVVAVRTALHRVTPDVLAQARATWAPRFASLKRPLAAVLVGGSNGRFRLGPTEAIVLTQGLREMMERDQVGIALTTSRRTGDEVTSILRDGLTPLGAWVWDTESDNPYLGLLACADAIVVTMDSVSMVSEAVASTVPVFVVPLPGRSRRIGLFMNDLVDQRRVKMFEGRFQEWPVAPLDDTAMAAEEMCQRLGLQIPTGAQHASV